MGLYISIVIVEVQTSVAIVDENICLVIQWH